MNVPSALKTLSQIASRYFAIWVLLAAVIGLLRPKTFQIFLPHIPLLLGIIMFGMGMTLRVDDFKEILAQPKEVAVGVVAQYTIMPLLAYGIAEAFRLPGELAVGVVLLGACPGGTASNVITYLAKGDVALSVAMTTASTLISPIMTPLLTLLLAGAWAPVPAGGLFVSAVKIVLIPVLMGLAAHIYFEEAAARWIAVLPLVSVATIVAVVGAIIGANADQILSAALTIFAVVILHNLLGLLLGYGAGSALGAAEPKKRAIAVEVGMQNSGLAAALAMAHFNPAAAIPGAIFSVWHNISGPILATWWTREDDHRSR
ncbi:MAG TPA: bile acid:sodium symporter family protein [Methanothrix sp.]|nr:bile acid:sodium symporter family protein [Methanothrix sp.]HPJ84723.1 bile acid:sodium symporter family protein [Methanothrix sp.]HPR66729.1 bile acid:sodium symporter family protein [Methanothrix sp.]